MAHGIADVMTLGLWDLVASPFEVAKDRDFSTVKVFYDDQSPVIRPEQPSIDQTDEVLEQ